MTDLLKNINIGIGGGSSSSRYNEDVLRNQLAQEAKYRMPLIPEPVGSLYGGMLGKKKSKEKTKRLVFDDTDSRHVQLKIRLDYDGLSQAEFFRSFITGYLNKDELVMNFIHTYKEKKKIQS